MATIKQIKEHLNLNKEWKKAKIYQWPWFKGYYFQSQVSLPLTKVLLILKLSPNSITLCYLLFALSANILIGFGKINLVIFGVIIAQLSVMFDYSDGTVARMTNNCTIKGYFLDWTIPYIIRPMYWLGLTFLNYAFYKNSLIFVLGFVIIISVITDFGLLCASFLFTQKLYKDNDLFNLRCKNEEKEEMIRQNKRSIKIKDVVLLFMNYGTVMIDAICIVAILSFYVKYIGIIYLVFFAVLHLLRFVKTIHSWFYKDGFEKTIERHMCSKTEGIWYL